MNARDLIEFSHENELVGSAHAVRCWTINHRRDVTHAKPARVGSANPHVHGDRLARHLACSGRAQAHKRVTGIGVVRREPAQHAVAYPGPVEGSSERRLDAPDRQTHRDADVDCRPGDGRDEIRGGAAFDEPDVHCEAPEHVGLACAGERLRDRPRGGDRCGHGSRGLGPQFGQG